MQNKPVFIHSLFRTGSTYLWNKFRQKKEYYCYYEPFNQFLSGISLERPFAWSHENEATGRVGHPDMTQNQLFEYKKLLEPGHTGVPLFKKSFGFDDYCRNEPHPDMKKYIDFLIRGAEEEGKIPVLQFNRSALRTRWFKKYYPGSVNIYLVRNPRDQWQSYVSLAEEQNLDIFLIMDLMTAGKNRHTSYFKSLASYVYLVEFHAEEFRHEEVVYRALLDTYTSDELYFIFYFTWLTALWENACHVDIILSIDLLASDKRYAERAAATLEQNDITGRSATAAADVSKGYSAQKKSSQKNKISEHSSTGIDLSDARPRRYPEHKLPARRMDDIEKMVKSLISRDHGSEKRDFFLSKLSREEKKFFNLSPKSLSAKKTTVFKTQGEDERVKKLESLMNRFLHLYVRALEEKGKTQQLQQTLIRIKKSYSFRVGKLILSPFRLIKKIKNRFAGKSK